MRLVQHDYKNNHKPDEEDYMQAIIPSNLLNENDTVFLHFFWGGGSCNVQFSQIYCHLYFRPTT